MGVIMFIGKVISTPGWVFLVISFTQESVAFFIYTEKRKRSSKDSVNRSTQQTKTTKSA